MVCVKSERRVKKQELFSNQSLLEMPPQQATKSNRLKDLSTHGLFKVYEECAKGSFQSSLRIISLAFSTKQNSATSARKEVLRRATITHSILEQQIDAIMPPQKSFADFSQECRK
jgi:hypothetical protein